MGITTLLVILGYSVVYSVVMLGNRESHLGLVPMVMNIFLFISTLVSLYFPFLDKEKDCLKDKMNTI